MMLDTLDRNMRTGSLLINSQYPAYKWHGFFPDPTIAEAVLDRVVHQAHRITLKASRCAPCVSVQRSHLDAPTGIENDASSSVTGSAPAFFPDWRYRLPAVMRTRAVHRIDSHRRGRQSMRQGLA